MDCYLSYAKPRFPTLPVGPLPRPASLRLGKALIVAASGNSNSKCDFNGLTAPLELKTPAGRFLTGVLLDDLDNFQVAAMEELERVSDQRVEAVIRSRLSVSSDEAVLHRRIEELTKRECKTEVEDIMYLLINHKFLDMRVYLIPKLTKCLYKGRLELWPSKDYELESIYTSEVLELVQEHLTPLVGYAPNSSVTKSWTTTQIGRLHLCQTYAASILYGYFLKSVFLRHGFEKALYPNKCNCFNQHPFSELFSIESEYIASGRISSARVPPIGEVSCGATGEEHSNSLRSFVMEFDKEMIQMCAMPKSKEGANLIRRHSRALFGNQKARADDDQIDDVITTSFGSLKRFLLEGVAFGSFLWEAEECVNDVYTLEENEDCS